jgi:hypothetical protein
MLRYVGIAYPSIFIRRLEIEVAARQARYPSADWWLCLDLAFEAIARVGFAKPTIGNYRRQSIRRGDLSCAIGAQA